MDNNITNPTIISWWEENMYGDIPTPKAPDDYAKKFNYEIFRERIKILLEEHDMTQLSLAEYLRIDPQTMNRWFNGHRKTPIKYVTLYEIAWYFNVNVHYLYDRDFSTPHKNFDDTKAAMQRIVVKHKPLLDLMRNIGVKYDPFPLPDDLDFAFSLDGSTLMQGYDDMLCKLEKKVSLFLQLEILRGESDVQQMFNKSLKRYETQKTDM